MSCNRVFPERGDVCSNALDKDHGQGVSSRTPVESVVNKDAVPGRKDDKHGDRQNPRH